MPLPKTPEHAPRGPCAHRARGALRWLAPLVAASLALPGVARAGSRTFSANSLIIPVQIEYQSDTGIIAAYGLVYTILLKNSERLANGDRPVTFHWAISPDKLSHHRCNTNTNTVPTYGAPNDDDGCDFAIQLDAGAPVALLSAQNQDAPLTVSATAYSVANGSARGPDVAVGSTRTAMKYLGGAFIVDATDRQAFIEMIGQFGELAQYRTETLRNGPNPAFVKIHSARTSFTAPVARVLNQRPPRVAVMDTTGASFLTEVLTLAGLDAIQDWNAAYPNGVVLEQSSADVLLDGDAANPHGLLNARQAADYRYGLVWIPDGGFTMTAGKATNLNWFVDGGGGAYVEANSIGSVENNASSRLQSAAGIGISTSNVAYREDCSNRSVPSTSIYYSSATGECFTYGNASQPYAQTGNFAFEGGQGNYKSFVPNVGGLLEGVDKVVATGAQVMASARHKDNDEEKGLVFYMAGHKFENGSRYWGQRLIMNSIVTNVPLIELELARSEPTGYKDTSGSTATTRVYQGTYVQKPDPKSDDVRIYNPLQAQRWQFPFVKGHLYEHDLVDITDDVEGQGFGARKNWDAGDHMPLPASRTIFTVLGGSAHLGWRKVTFRHDEITASTCADEDDDAKCDLAEALAACGAAGVTTNVLKTVTDTTSDGALQRTRLGTFVQQVRGHCYPSPTTPWHFTPTDAQCLSPRQDNRAKLGGIDHGSPAIVGPSRYVTGTPWSTRPVVAYAGGRDGMLHAFYVSGGSDWGTQGLPAGIVAGTELWAMIPPGQLCGLRSNDAMVDASVNVIDVFGDFPSDANNDGVIDWSSSSAERPTGIRRWRTVLLATTAVGSELFALDVTHPLRPVLLWHVTGKREKDARWDANANGEFGAGETFNASDPRTHAWRWIEQTDTEGLSSVNGVTKERTGRFDYRNLGRASGTAVGKMWEGNAFRYVAYLSTSTADYTAQAPEGSRGIEVFALDLVTGQKLWQWQRRYARKNAEGNEIADNAMPGRPALADVNSDGQVDRIYVGDLEGHLWELDARLGGNLNYLPSTASTIEEPAYYSFPLYGTPRMTAPEASDEIRALFALADGSGLAQQPLTTAVGVGRFSAVPREPANLEPYLLGRLALVQGTMGVDWSIAPYEPGRVVVLPAFWEYGTRTAYFSEGTKVDLRATPNPRMFGVLDPRAVWDIELDVGERVFGMPRIVANEVIFTTAYGGFNGDISETIGETGMLHRVGSSGVDGEVAIPSKAMGGVLVFEGKLVVTTATKMLTQEAPTVTESTSQRPFNRSTPAIFRTWERPQSTEVKK